MRKIGLGLAFAAAITATPTLAQEHKNNSRECAKEVGANPDLRRGRPNRFIFHSEAQHTAFLDCLTRRPNVASTPPPATRKTGGGRNSD
jgi:hypothetical protein